MKVGFVSLGCPKNQLDTEVMLHEVIAAGYEITPDETEADAQLLQCVHGSRLLVLEDCVEEGCLGQHIAALLQQNGQNIRLKLCNLGSSFVTHGKVEQLYTMLGIDAAGVAECAKELRHG